MEKSLSPHVRSVRVDSDKAALAVLSDVHQGLNDREYLKETIDFLVGLGDKCKVIIGGDSTNTTTRGSKGCVLEEWASGEEQILSLADDIRPLVETGQLIGIVSGNHPQRMYNEVFVNPEMMIASVLGDRKLYMGEIGIIYFNVNNNLYVHHVLHKHRKTEGYYDHFNADVTWLEHFHAPKAVPHLVVEHNKYRKKPIFKEVWSLWQGSFQTYPSYSKAAGHRPLLPGFFICEMTGDDKKKEVVPYLDHVYRSMIDGGYRL